jgi:TPR repeat protein
MQKAREKNVDMFLKIAKEYNDNKTNKEKAFAWYYQAALQDNDEGQYQVGNRYHNGHGVSKDYEQAMDWFLKAVNNGNTEAMRLIGWMYLIGKGATKNIHTAIEWYTKAANQGNAEAQYYLGNVYHYKDEVKNLQLSVNWFQKAADNNHADAKSYLKKLNDNGYFAEEEQKGIDYWGCFYFLITNDNIKHLIME